MMKKTSVQVQALADIRGYAAVNRIRFSRHAREEMGECGAEPEDAQHALANATGCELSEDGPGRWETTGPDLNGEVLTCVVVLDDGVVVITVW
jgi:hypothetical protein